MISTFLHATKIFPERHHDIGETHVKKDPHSSANEYHKECVLLSSREIVESPKVSPQKALDSSLYSDNCPPLI